VMRTAGCPHSGDSSGSGSMWNTSSSADPTCGGSTQELADVGAHRAQQASGPWSVMPSITDPGTLYRCCCQIMCQLLRMAGYITALHCTAWSWQCSGCNTLLLLLLLLPLPTCPLLSACSRSSSTRWPPRAPLMMQAPRGSQLSSSALMMPAGAAHSPAVVKRAQPPPTAQGVHCTAAHACMHDLYLARQHGLVNVLHSCAMGHGTCAMACVPGFWCVSAGATAGDVA
jgi:hypothetical protein